MKNTNNSPIPSSQEDEHDRLNRRELLKISSRAAAFAGTGIIGSTLASCNSNKPSASGEPVLKIGYIPITDATPLLVAHALGFFEEEGIQTEDPVLIRGWSALSEAFLAGQFNFVHLLMPIPIYMRFAEGHSVKVMAWDHMNGSAITTGLNTGIENLEDLAGKQIAVPYWYSIHNIIVQLCLRHYDIEIVMQDREKPLKPNQTNLFVMRPPDMPNAMAAGIIDGYAVAEPFNAVGEVLAGGRITRFIGDVFKDHPCCVAVMQEELTTSHPDWTQRVMNAFVRAQLFAANNKSETAYILSKDGKGYLPFSKDIIERAISKYDLETYGLRQGTGAIQHPEWKSERLGFQPYPFQSTAEEIVKMLKVTKVEGDASFLAGLEPEQVATELFDFDKVKKAADKVGGLGVFDGITDPDSLVRTEVIEV